MRTEEIHITVKFVVAEIFEYQVGGRFWFQADNFDLSLFTAAAALNFSCRHH